MLTLIKKHYKSLKFTPVPYSEYSHIISAAKKSNPMVWMPGWKVTDQKNKEIILFDVGCLIFGSGNNITVSTENHLESIKGTDVFSFLKVMETEWKSIRNSSFDFYFGLLSYDLQHKKHHIIANTNFYQLPDITSFCRAIVILSTTLKKP